MEKENSRLGLEENSAKRIPFGISNPKVLNSCHKNILSFTKLKTLLYNNVVRLFHHAFS